jgi:hypothetical protein
MKTPKVLQVYRIPPNHAQITKVVSEQVVGKLPSPHLYGNKPEIHTVSLQIPISMLLS